MSVDKETLFLNAVINLKQRGVITRFPSSLAQIYSTPQFETRTSNKWNQLKANTSQDTSIIKTSPYFDSNAFPPWTDKPRETELSTTVDICRGIGNDTWNRPEVNMISQSHSIPNNYHQIHSINYNSSYGRDCESMFDKNLEAMDSQNCLKSLQLEDSQITEQGNKQEIVSGIEKEDNATVDESMIENLQVLEKEEKESFDCFPQGFDSSPQNNKNNNNNNNNNTTNSVENETAIGEIPQTRNTQTDFMSPHNNSKCTFKVPLKSMSQQHDDNVFINITSEGLDSGNTRRESEDCSYVDDSKNAMDILPCNSNEDSRGETGVIASENKNRQRGIKR